MAVNGSNRGGEDLITTERHEALVELCKDLVSTRSYSGEERDVAERIKRFGHETRFDVVEVDRLGNVILGIVGSRPGPTIVFDGHIDTVPVTEERWSFPPFGAEQKNGRMYGRGTSDMKGAVSAMLMAARCYKEDTNGAFAGNVYVTCTVHEEQFEGLATREVVKRLKPDYVVIGEASDLNLNRGQRGRAEIVVEVFGKPAHSSNPKRGINAVNKMITVISHIQKIEQPVHPVLGEGILELTDIHSLPYPGASVVPSYCKATFDRRLLVGETPESVLGPIQETISSLQQLDSDLQATVSFASGTERCYTGSTISGTRFFPAWLFDEEEDFVQRSLQALSKSGLEAVAGHYSFCTNGSCFAGEEGIATVGFGPSQEYMAHIDDESVEIDDVERAWTGYYALMREFCAP